MPLKGMKLRIRRLLTVVQLRWISRVRMQSDAINPTRSLSLFP